MNEILEEFDLVVFDIAGTTVKDGAFVATALQSALRDHGSEFSIESINHVMGLPKPVAIAQLTEREVSDPEIVATHDKFLQYMNQFYRTSKEVEPIQGVPGTFRFLRERGIKVTLDTGFGTETTEIILNRLGWNSEVVDGYICSDQVQRGRPYPDMIVSLMERFGISDPKRVIKVGDTKSDVREGKVAGCGLVIAVTSGADSRATLEAEKPDAILQSVAELPQLLMVRAYPRYQR